MGKSDCSGTSKATRNKTNVDPKMREHLRLIRIGTTASESTKQKMRRTQLIVQKDPSLRQIQSDAHKGEKSHLWKGGITSLALGIRHCHKMRIWKEEVFARDNYTCTKCLRTKLYLNAHHIIKFSKLLKKYNIKTIEDAENCDELWDISNGKSLCKECHKREHASN